MRTAYGREEMTRRRRRLEPLDPEVKAVKRLTKPRVIQFVQSETHKDGLKTLIQR